MTDLSSRVEHAGLRRKVRPAEDVARELHGGEVLAVSGFTRSGDPKVTLGAVARHFEKNPPSEGITLYSGASISDEVETPLAPFIVRRAPYMSCARTRRRIHEGQTEYADLHLSQFARNFAAGFYGAVDLAVVEVSRIRADGSVVLTSSVGLSVEALMRAKRVVLEVNTVDPDYTGFHDLVAPPVPPGPAWPLPITDVLSRIGTTALALDPDKVIGVVESRVPGLGVEFKPAEDVHRRIAANVVEFLLACRARFGWGDWLPPIQSGVGNVANAVVAALYEGPFRRVSFWTEVFQDGMLRFVEDHERFGGASASGLSLSRKGAEELGRLFERCRDKVVLRPMWVSNSPEVVARLFTVAMNTPLEVDIYGHVNSTRGRGSPVMNGLGGSGDFLRNAYLSIVHTPSVRRLRDGRIVSCVMPYLDHVDHTEHDTKCIVTEHGFADLTAIRSPRHRAEDVIAHCAHPHFRPVLREYMGLSGSGDEPHTTRLETLEGWWSDYEAACASFPADAPTLAPPPRATGGQ